MFTDDATSLQFESRNGYVGLVLRVRPGHAGAHLLRISVPAAALHASDCATVAVGTRRPQNNLFTCAHGRKQQPAALAERLRFVGRIELSETDLHLLVAARLSAAYGQRVAISDSDDEAGGERRRGGSSKRNDEEDR